MADNKSNQRADNPRNDNDAFGSSSRSGRGGSWSNRDDDDMQLRGTRSDRPRSAYDSELNARMEQGGSHTSAYGDEFSTSGDRYRETTDHEHDRSRDRDRDRSASNRGRTDAGMGADSWGGGADRDTGRDRYNRNEPYSAGGSYSDREVDRNDYYGNRPAKEGGDMQSGMRARSPRGSQSQETQRGQHAGRGPKGYRRDDARITEDVNEMLTRDGHIDASDIEVEVSGGEVTLRGTVDSRDAKRYAEDIAESISGVCDVNNHIRVSRGGVGSSSTSDSEVHRMSNKSGRDNQSGTDNKSGNDKMSDPNSEKAHHPSTKDGAAGGTSTADGAMSSQGSGPSGAANTSTNDKNPSVKSIPGTQGTSAHKTQSRGT